MCTLSYSISKLEPLSLGWANGKKGLRSFIRSASIDKNVRHFWAFMGPKHELCQSKFIEKATCLLEGCLFGFNMQMSLPEVYPCCKCKHTFFKHALKHFAKLYPGMVGSESQSLLFNGCSQSFRVVLYHFRLCTKHETWRTAKNVSMGDAVLLKPVEEILGMIVLDDEDDDDEEPDGLAIAPTPKAKISTKHQQQQQQRQHGLGSSFCKLSQRSLLAGPDKIVNRGVGTHKFWVSSNQWLSIGLGQSCFDWEHLAPKCIAYI